MFVRTLGMYNLREMLLSQAPIDQNNVTVLLFNGTFPRSQNTLTASLILVRPKG